MNTKKVKHMDMNFDVTALSALNYNFPVLFDVALILNFYASKTRTRIISSTKSKHFLVTIICKIGIS